jgi:glycosyltransferase involved in cell wall biosynthesis
MELSVVMPVYNEAGCIERVVRSVETHILGRLESSELVVVDDASTDATASILDRLAGADGRLRVLHQHVNSGHGAAIRRGFEEARGDFVFQMDSDDQFLCEDFWKLWEVRADSDVVMGVRRVRHDPVHRLAITRILRLVDRALFGVVLEDANVPFKLMRRCRLEEWLALVPADAVAPSIMLAVVAARRGHRVREVPVTHLARATGTGSLVPVRLIKICLCCVRQLFDLARALRARERGRGHGHGHEK